MPEVSVIIPVYNAAATISDALVSVFAQTFRDFEVVAIDDGSTDDLSHALLPWRSRITLITQTNRGPAAARNAGIRVCGGRLIAFLDADDVWLPYKLERQVDYFRAYPATGLVHTDAIELASETLVMSEGDRGLPSGRRMEPPEHVFCPLFHADLAIASATVMVRRDVLGDVGCFDECRDLHVEDWELWLRIAARYPVGYVPEALALHRLGGFMSSAVERTYRGQELAIQKTLPLCRTACAQHAEASAQCLRHRLHRLHMARGYYRLTTGNRRGARADFRRAEMCRPWKARSYIYHATSFLSDSLLQHVWRFRQRRSRELANVQDSKT